MKSVVHLATHFDILNSSIYHLYGHSHAEVIQIKSFLFIQDMFVIFFAGCVAIREPFLKNLIFNQFLTIAKCTHLLVKSVKPDSAIGEYGLRLSLV